MKGFLAYFLLGDASCAEHVLTDGCTVHRARVCCGILLSFSPESWGVVVASSLCLVDVFQPVVVLLLGHP